MVLDRYWTTELHKLISTGSVQSTFPWIVRTLDFILLIQLMPPKKSRGPRPEGRKTKAQRAEDRGPPGPVGIIGERAASPLTTSYSLGTAVSSGSGSGAATAAKLFSRSKRKLWTVKKSANTYIVVLFRARFIATVQYHWRCRMVVTTNG